MSHRCLSVPQWLRLAGLLIIVGLFIWIPFEDQDSKWVLVMSAVISAWLAVRLLLNIVVSDWQKVMWHSLIGGLAGLAIAPLAFLLMLFKSGLHGHAVADFTVDQFQSVFGVTPFLLLSGLLIGLGLGLWRAVREYVSR